MRRLNAYLGPAIAVLFVIHGIAGAFQVMGVFPGGQTTLIALAWVLLAIIAIHVVIGCVLTWRSLRAWRASSVAYWKANKLFWARRASGFGLLLLVIEHTIVFMSGTGSGFRLVLFDGVQLVAALLLVACAAIHVLTNIKPARISLGLVDKHAFSIDVLWVLAVLLMFMAIAFCVYFVRWSVI